MKKTIRKNLQISNRILAKQFFSKWLKRNTQKFSHILVKTEKIDEYYIQGITRQIKCIVDFQIYDVMLSFEDDEGRVYDYHSIAYIGKFCLHKKLGFYDADRIDKKYKYYKSFEKLLINELFNPLLKYINRIFVNGTFLYLYGSDYDDGWTSANILLNGELESEKWRNKRKYKIDIFESS